MKYSKKSIQIISASLIAIAFVSCKKDKTFTPVSAISFVNASVDAPSLNVFMNQNKVSNEEFTFGKNIPYLRAYSGQREVLFYEGTVKKTSGTFDLKDGKFYSLFLTGKWPDTELVLLKDSLVSPATGKANIRFVNMGKDAGELDLGLTNGSTLISKKAYKAGSDFISVNGNAAYTFVIRKNNVLTDTVSIPSTTLEAGKNYTIWAKGLKTSTGNNTLSLAVIKNN